MSHVIDRIKQSLENQKWELKEKEGELKGINNLHITKTAEIREIKDKIEEYTDFLQENEALDEPLLGTSI